jgi:hypothetical protein
MFSALGLTASAIACGFMAMTLRSYRADILEFLARVQADLMIIKTDVGEIRELTSPRVVDSGGEQ